MRAIAIFSLLVLLVGCQAQPTVSSAIAAAAPAVVKIYGPGFSCSGFHAGGGIFITAAHCAAGEPLVWIEDAKGVLNVGVPVVIDEAKDVASIKALKTIDLPALQLFPNQAQPSLGAEIISLGFPAYYNLSPMFEVGHIKDTFLLNGTKTILSRELAYMGYSGGPILDVQTGTVLGISSSMSEIVRDLPDFGDHKPRHQHVSLAQIVSSDEIYPILDQTRVLLEQE